MKKVAELQNISITKDGKDILKNISLTILENEKWVILGPNGAGKTTLLNLLYANIFPSKGECKVLGNSFGASDINSLKTRIGFASDSVINNIPANETIFNLVLSAGYGIYGKWKEKYLDIDLQRAYSMLKDWNLADLSDKTIGEISSGELKRLLIARSLMSDPEFLLLDEPFANLDMGSRAELIYLLGEYAVFDKAPCMTLVTHHIEEIPKNFTHAILLKNGKILHKGPIEKIVTSKNISELFDYKFEIVYKNKKFSVI